MEGEHEHEEEEKEEPAASHTQIVQAPQELTQPVIDHAERIARIEQQQAEHAVRFAEAIAAAESRLREEMASRLAAAEAAAARAAEAAKEPPEEVADLVEEEVEVPHVVKETPRGIRGRRKAKRSR
jgi:hypothetical protein